MVVCGVTVILVLLLLGSYVLYCGGADNSGGTGEQDMRVIALIQIRLVHASQKGLIHRRACDDPQLAGIRRFPESGTELDNLLLSRNRVLSIRRVKAFPHVDWSSNR
jgi:hypothetical protein